MKSCSSTISQGRRLRTMQPFFALFAVFMVFEFAQSFSQPVEDSHLAWAMDLGTGISMVGMLLAAAIGLARQRDEFQRRLLTQAMIWGVGGMLAITMVWGLLEVHTSIPKMDILLNFPIFAAITAIAKVTLFRSNPVSEE